MGNRVKIVCNNVFQTTDQKERRTLLNEKWLKLLQMYERKMKMVDGDDRG